MKNVLVQYKMKVMGIVALTCLGKCYNVVN